jgi:hypothetical protein
MGVRLMENGNMLLDPEDFSWEIEDIKVVDEKSEIYKRYLECMNHFFRRKNDD